MEMVDQGGAHLNETDVALMAARKRKEQSYPEFLEARPRLRRSLLLSWSCKVLWGVDGDTLASHEVEGDFRHAGLAA